MVFKVGTTFTLQYPENSTKTGHMDVEKKRKSSLLFFWFSLCYAPPRLPQHLSFDLRPAPLDLSITEASEKSPIPSLIVTPSSPKECESPYYIAFMAPPAPPSPPPKATLAERFVPPLPISRDQFRPRLRTTVLIGFTVLILLFHFLAHTFAAKRPHFEFGLQSSDGEGSSIFGLFDLFGDGFPGRRDFIVDEASIADSVTGL
ncbi:hypothetical protein DL96DRAFT_1746479 [Flagelloscypha sp. PMI_526]|nr:hypothetical protein DL96DRAFT_1746479 [Flagelloscypha sp. PMI_526]